MHAILDGDILIYQAASKAETFVQWSDEVWTLHARADIAEELLGGYIETMIDKVGATEFSIAVTTGKLFRHEIYPAYKGNRDARKKPMLIGHLREWVMAQYGDKAYCVNRLEADDVMGILSTSPTRIKGDRIIVSLDKDFRTIPGKFYDYGKDHTYEISEDDANHFWMLQTLMGDATDHYPGCPGMGPVSAAKLLPEGMPLEEMWPLVVSAFAKKGLDEDYAILMARLARILRTGDYNFKTKEVNLWTPQPLR